MSGLVWLAGRGETSPWLSCFTFVRGTPEREILQAFGADPDRPAGLAAVSPGAAAREVIRVGRSGEWVFVLEETARPQGTRLEVLERVSRAGEAVVVFEEIGKGNHE